MLTNKVYKGTLVFGQWLKEEAWETMLHFMRHASAHGTVMRKLISQSGGWGNADEAEEALQGQLGKQKQALEMRIAKYIKRIGDGKDSAAVTAALDKCEMELVEVQELPKNADNQIAMDTIKRPTAAEVQSIWKEFLELWEEATDKERKTVMARFVRKVEVTGKNKASLQIVGPIAGTLDGKFALQANVGAGRAVTTTSNPRCHDSPLFIPAGGQSRTKMPRPARQTRI